MNKHITPSQAAYEATCASAENYTAFMPPWQDTSASTKKDWRTIAAAAIRAHLSSIGARGGGKGTPAQARAARKNGLGNRKSKGKPRPPGNAG